MYTHSVTEKDVTRVWQLGIERGLAPWRDLSCCGFILPI